jgi:peptidoglycan/LPS O-acetylase OafA/YrhL
MSLDGTGGRERHTLSNYFIRRFFRIAPLFYTVLVVNLVLRYVAPMYSSSAHLAVTDILLGALFLNGVRPLAINVVVAGGWSIAVETTFYLILPWLHKYFNTARRSLVLFAVSAPAMGFLSTHLATRAVDGAHYTYFAFLWFPVEFPVFVLGILGYCVWKDFIKNRVDGSNQQKTLSLILLLTSFMLYCACLPFSDRGLYFSSYLFLPLLLALSVYPWPLLDNVFTRLVGRVSYSLYLLQFFVLMFFDVLLRHVRNLPGDPTGRYFGHSSSLAVVYLCVLAVSLPICVLSWMFIEQPGIRLGRRIIARREGRAERASLVPSIHTIESVENSRDAQF